MEIHADPPMDALRISPKYRSLDWYALDSNAPKDWSKAADVIRDRLEGRFLRFASKSLGSKHSGFVVLAIDRGHSTTGLRPTAAGAILSRRG
jgi:hypothetical protein